jgi:hypothetical protein
LALPGLELQPLSHPAHSQSLYRLRYPAPFTEVVIENKRMKEKKKQGAKAAVNLLSYVKLFAKKIIYNT